MCVNIADPTQLRGGAGGGYVDIKMGSFDIHNRE
jgi:hypothetical protein